MPSDRSVWPHLAEPADIIQWAGRLVSRSELPVLIRRLIRADNSTVSKLLMRGYEGVGISGPDGEVFAASASPFVPQGESIWEMGVSQDPATKANSDYKKRTDAGAVELKNEKTFVFVTPRSWPGKSDWADAKSAEGIWKKVIAHDVDDIHTALEHASGLHYWFTGSIGNLSAGLQPIEEWWKSFSTLSSPHLLWDEFIRGKEDLAAILIGAISDEMRVINIKVPSINDLLTFFHAAIMNLPQIDRDDLLSRSLVVKDSHSFNFVLGAPDHLALVPFEESLYRLATTLPDKSVLLAVQGNEASFLEIPGPFPDSNLGTGSILAVQPGNQNPIVASNSREAQSQELALLSRSISMSASLGKITLRNLWMLGAWNLDRSVDKTLIEHLLSTSWGELETELSVDLNSEFPVFKRISDTWAVRDVIDSWEFCEPRLVTSDFEIFERAIQVVLGAGEDLTDFPLGELWNNPISTTERLYSRDLRKGLSESLAFLSSVGEERKVRSSLTITVWTRQVIQRLLVRANDDSTGYLWESLAEVYSLLAEAAPNEFLDNVRRGILDGGSLRQKLFNQDRLYSIDLVSNTHVNLLFALETLAWNAEYLSATAETMANLAELVGETRPENSPLKSLSKVFLPLLPQTQSPIERRIEVIDGLISRHLSIAWKLLLSLLPSSHTVVFPSPAPKFHDWGASIQQTPPGPEYFELTNRLLDRVMEIVRAKRESWIDLLEHFDSLYFEQRSRILSELSRDHVDFEDGALRLELYEKLMEKVRRHKEFPDAKWAFEQQEIEEIESVAQQFKPQNFALSERWLFNEQHPDLGAEYQEDESVFQAHLAEKRSQACRSVLAQSGFEGILNLARNVNFPEFLGWAYGFVDGVLDFEVAELLDSQDSKIVHFSMGFFDSLVSKGFDIEQILGGFENRPLVLSRLLNRMEDLPDAWGLVDQLGAEVKNNYWREFRVFGRGQDFGFANEAARHLLDNGFFLNALEILSFYSDRASNVPDLLLIEEALNDFAISQTLESEVSNHLSWTLKHLLEILQRGDFDPLRIATLEWKLLPALGYGYKVASIERLLASDPVFFISLLSMVYRSENDADEQVGDLNASRNVFQILHDWTQIPGSNGPNQPADAEKLKEWVATTRELASHAHRLNAADSVIGQVLAHSPAGEDGSWPTRGVRDLIEVIDSEALWDGFVIGIRNLRGVYSRSIEEGGSQERALAEKYENWRAQIVDRWPGVASLLARVADSYRVESFREDERSQLWQEGLDT